MTRRVRTLFPPFSRCEELAAVANERTAVTDELNPYVSRTQIASEISERFFPVKARTLRTWQEPPTIIIAGRACARRSEWFAAAERRMADACCSESKNGQPKPAKAHPTSPIDTLISTEPTK